MGGNCRRPRECSVAVCVFGFICQLFVTDRNTLQEQLRGEIYMELRVPEASVHGWPTALLWAQVKQHIVGEAGEQGGCSTLGSQEAEARGARDKMYDSEGHAPLWPPAATPYLPAAPPSPVLLPSHFSVRWVNARWGYLSWSNPFRCEHLYVNTWDFGEDTSCPNHLSGCTNIRRSRLIC